LGAVHIEQSLEGICVVDWPRVAFVIPNPFDSIANIVGVQIIVISLIPYI